MCNINPLSHLSFEILSNVYAADPSGFLGDLKRGLVLPLGGLERSQRRGPLSFTSQNSFTKIKMDLTVDILI